MFPTSLALEVLNTNPRDVQICTIVGKGLQQAYAFNKPKCTDSRNNQGYRNLKDSSELSFGQLKSLKNEENRIFSNLKGIMDLEELAFKADIPIYKLSSILLSLELKKLVKPIPGRKIRKI